jgi:hypothetical protein
MAIGPDRLVCMGRFLGDSNFIKRIFYTTDGATMVAGPTGIGAVFSFQQVPDGVCRGAAFSSTLNKYIFAGASGSNFFLPGFLTTQDGTAVALQADMAAGSNNADSADAIWVSDFGLAVVSWNAPGTPTPVAYQRSATGLAASWVATNEAVGFTPRARQLAYSSELARLVAACGTGGFNYTDDGINWNSVAATVADNWVSVVATA